MAVCSLATLILNDQFDRRFIGLRSGVARSSPRSLFAAFSDVHWQVVRAPAIGIFPDARWQKLSMALRLTCACRALTLASISSGNAP